MKVLQIAVRGDIDGLSVDFHKYEAVDHPAPTWRSRKYLLNSLQEQGYERILDKNRVNEEIPPCEVDISGLHIVSIAYIPIEENNLGGMLGKVANMVEGMNEQIQKVMDKKMGTLFRFSDNIAKGCTYSPPAL